MLIVGELINSSRKAMRPLIEARNAAAIQEVAKAQEAAGAGYLDVNCGTFTEDEPERLAWLVETVQAVSSLPLCLDSPNPQAMAAALPLVKTTKPLLNSISAEQERLEAMLPLIQAHGTRVIALTMSDAGIPTSTGERLEIATHLIETLAARGVALDDIFIDPLVQPVSTVAEGGQAVLQAVRRIKERWPEVHCICGLSNISFGLPGRALLNRVFMTQAMAAGMDAFILNPTDRPLMGAYHAANALLGQDNYCMQYLKAYRGGLYEA